MNKLHFLLIPVCLLLFTCKKDDLPKATEKGANTFGCKINGITFRPCNDNSLFGSPSLFASLSVSASTSVTVFAQCTENFPYKNVTINLGNFHGTGDYLLSDNENNICEYDEPDPYPDKNYSSYFTKNGKVTVTKDDRTNYILSGTFSFTAANQDSIKNIVTITDGRFDVNYKR